MWRRPVRVHHSIDGFLLAFMAGLMNAWTLAHAQTFATVQSGNVVQSGYRLVQGDWAAFVFSFGSVIAFGIGSALCGVLMTEMLRRGRVFTPVVLFGEVTILVGLAIAARMELLPRRARHQPCIAVLRGPDRLHRRHQCAEPHEGGGPDRRRHVRLRRRKHRLPGDAVASARDH